ncbi:MAG: DUF2550 family protein [Streptosporangiales bacterium]|nr:DUF2550 family protein [Streptosporangiales bacterium]
MRGQYLAYEVVGALASLVVAVLLALIVIAVRRRWLQWRGATVDCGLRIADHGGRWMLGVARYDGESLQWYRIFSLAPRPFHIMRRTLVITGRRRPHPDEIARLPVDSVVVSCHDRGAAVELGMSEPALTGFLAWLESAPPGTHHFWS